MRALVIVPKDRSMTREQWKHLDRIGRTVMRAATWELKRAMSTLANPPVISLGDSSTDVMNVVWSPGKVFHIYRWED